MVIGIEAVCEVELLINVLVLLEIGILACVGEGSTEGIIMGHLLYRTIAVDNCAVVAKVVDYKIVEVCASLSRSIVSVISSIE